MQRQKPKFMSFSKLNSQRKKELIQNIEIAYGFDTEFLNEYFFYLTSKEKVLISKIDNDKLKLERINSIGVYFGVYHDEKRFRLSLEGSKFIKPTKNYIKINSKEILSSYLSAENLFHSEVELINVNNNYPFLIVQFENENLGCVSNRETELLTYMPKSRKLDYNKVF